MSKVVACILLALDDEEEKEIVNRKSPFSLVGYGNQKGVFFKTTPGDYKAHDDAMRNSVRSIPLFSRFANQKAAVITALENVNQ
ncbi:hypothetical protein E2C01_072695 [Portunus trituberculatus]|uniref:Uncharacterized protein n=1 Tax=Portunus trituberculatus TaxID=210409 RepID=A0A5B7I384_PORTR|nr:hypothetical protein [Portunus trituberculatus]